MKYQSTAFLSTGSAHQSMPPAFLSNAKVLLPSPRLANGLSSITAHPALDTTPSSSSLRLLSPICPSSVRVVPLRFRALSLPGYQSTCLPFMVSVMLRLFELRCAASISSPTLYLSVRADVLISSHPFSSVVLNLGTGRLRFTTPKVARSSNKAFLLY